MTNVQLGVALIYGTATGFAVGWITARWREDRKRFAAWNRKDMSPPDRLCEDPDCGHAVADHDGDGICQVLECRCRYLK